MNVKWNAGLVALSLLLLARASWADPEERVLVLGVLNIENQERPRLNKEATDLLAGKLNLAGFSASDGGAMRTGDRTSTDPDHWARLAGRANAHLVLLSHVRPVDGTSFYVHTVLYDVRAGKSWDDPDENKKTCASCADPAQLAEFIRGRFNELNRTRRARPAAARPAQPSAERRADPAISGGPANPIPPIVNPPPPGWSARKKGLLAGAIVASVLTVGLGLGAILDVYTKHPPAPGDMITDAEWAVLEKAGYSRAMYMDRLCKLNGNIYNQPCQYEWNHDLRAATGLGVGAGVMGATAIGLWIGFGASK